MTLYECPTCHDTSVAPVGCDRCERPMQRRGDPPPLVKPARQTPWRLAFTMGGLLIGLVMMLLASMGEAGLGRAAITVASPPLGILLGWLVGTVASKLARRSAEKRSLARWTSASTPIAKATDGPVEIRGVVHVVKPVQSQVSGVPCAGYVHHYAVIGPSETFEKRATADRFESDSAIGELEIRDDSGAVARLPAGPCELVAMLTGSSGEARLHDDARVVVRGVGRWETTMDPDGGYRGQVRRLVVQGFLGAPLQLRLDESPAPTAGVRVDAAASEGVRVDVAPTATVERENAAVEPSAPDVRRATR